MVDRLLYLGPHANAVLCVVRSSHKNSLFTAVLEPETYQPGGIAMTTESEELRKG